MSTLSDLYRELVEQTSEKLILQQINSILAWDQHTYMPPKGVIQRAKQKALLASLIHKRRTDPKIGKLLQALQTHSEISTLTEVERRNIEIIDREYRRYSKVPSELAVKIAQQSPISIQAWENARREKEYSILKPEMDKMLELVKERCHYINSDLKPIDVIIDEYEPGVTADYLSSLFTTLKAGLIQLLERIHSSPIKPDLSIVNRECTLEIQTELSHAVANVVQYDLERGRIDTSAHPFTNGLWDDVRITTRYDPNDFSDSFFAVMHESGHALYNQNLNKGLKYQQVGLPCSGGVHESQSRFIENIIGRSREFWQYYFPIFQMLTKGIYDDVTLEEFVLAINEVKPSKIRVKADEVTYSLHVILRFEIERDLLEGKISTVDLPDIWNAKYKEYLGIDFEDDSEGVMQDIHWPAGGFGAFYSYALGNMYSAQILHTMKKQIPNYKEIIEKGDIKTPIDWLSEYVHQKSNLYDPLTLIEQITGEPLDPKYYLQYLDEKYTDLYQL
ncbi:MAG: carboxypeptidase M32 [Candidatus Heimdallarchaeota archaeon]